MSPTPPVDAGLTHLALVVRDLERSRCFYETFAGLELVHQRTAGGPVKAVAWMADPHSAVAWMADPHSAFAIVLVESTELADTPLGPFGHLGLACASKADVDRMAALAEGQGILRSPPTDSGHPVGYWTYIGDPDGNTLELSYGQQIRFAAETAGRP